MIKNYLFKYHSKFDDKVSDYYAVVLADTDKKAWVHAMNIAFPRTPKELKTNIRRFELVVELVQKDLAHYTAS